MDPVIQKQVDLVGIINLIPYLDINLNLEKNGSITLSELVTKYADELSGKEEFRVIKAAVDANKSEFGSLTIVNQSKTNETDEWTDDLIQGCTIMDSAGNYYVSYRGTGEGRWPDNGKGLVEKSTPMQEAAAAYFDEMAEKYLIDASNQGKEIVVTGHSKGGNEAQYVYMAARHEEIIDKCISLDGQGFSEKAVKSFKERYGEDRYKEKLSSMYSVNGEKDYVHSLGIAIIPEENTYYVGTTGTDFDDFHRLDKMLVNQNGEYRGIEWIDPETQKPYEQGEFGKLVKELSENMMKMDEEDLEDASNAIMFWIDAVYQKRIKELLTGTFDGNLSDCEYNNDMFLDVLADGVPVIIKTLLSTEEGRAILSRYIENFITMLYKKYGVVGTVTILALIGFVLVDQIFPLGNFISLVDLVVDGLYELLEINEKVSDFIRSIKKSIIEAYERIESKIRKYTSGYKYADSHPKIVTDTYKLDNYALRLKRVNKRIKNIDKRLDALYSSVGLLDLRKLMQADALTGYSWRLLRCASYLEETADDFNSVENKLIKSI